MEIDEETQKKIQELQSYEQALHSLLLQKQAFQIELSEAENALSEVTKTKDEVFKIVGNIMIKAKKEDIEKDLKHKKEILSIRLKSIEKQESEITKELEDVKEEVMKKIK